MLIFYDKKLREIRNLASLFSIKWAFYYLNALIISPYNFIDFFISGPIGEPATI